MQSWWPRYQSCFKLVTFQMAVKSVTYVSNVIGMSFRALCNKITRETKFISPNIALFTTINCNLPTYLYLEDEHPWPLFTSVSRLNLFINHRRKYKRLCLPLNYSGLKLKVLKPFNKLAVPILWNLIPVVNPSNFWTDRNRTPLLLLNIHLKGATFAIGYQQHRHAQ